MSRRKRILPLIAILLLAAFLLTSCNSLLPSPSEPSGENQEGENQGGETEGGENQGGENGNEAARDPSKIYLVKDGQVNFSFVYSFSDYSSEFRNHLFASVSQLQKSGIMADAVRDDLDTQISEYEVLVGTFLGREEATVSKYILGNKGYTIRVIGNKIVILGGTEESLTVALDIFVSEYLSYDAGTKNITLDRDHNKTVRESYAITSLAIDGVELSAGGFKLVCDPSDESAMSAARLMQIRMYDSAGYYLEITEQHDGRGIYIKSTEKSELDGFRAYTEGGSLYVECQYPPLFESEMEKYLQNTIKDSASGDVEVGASYSRLLHTVSYFDFGAVGDGATDDFAAIKLAHDTANKYGLKIDACGDERRDDGAVFHLGAHSESIRIETDTDWTGAEFIIDDTLYSVTSPIRSTNVFTVATSLKVNTQLKGQLTSLSKGATNIGFTLDQKYIVILYNSNVRQYIRYGSNADSGAVQQEVILVHENGDIDESTPLLWDYATVTDVKMYPASDTPITVTGGVFTTVANQAPRQYNYYSRGIAITRSNVTVSNITHLITGEGDTGAPYNGFLAVSCCNNILFENIVYSGHKTYKLETDSSNSMGTYDISASNANAITWRGCTQTNSITDKSLWGIMGSNYCKNLTYDGCILSRFDAHKGMYNSSIINSEIGHAGITAIGAGCLRIEGTTVNSNQVVHLRSDYGSTWDGVVIIKDVILKNSGKASIFSGSWYDHYFGYVCHLPSVIIDNLKISTGSSVTVFSGFSNSDITSASTNNPVAIGGSVTIRNNKNGYQFNVASNSYVESKITVTNE